MGKSAWKVDVLLHGSWHGATSVLLSKGLYQIVVDTGMPHEAHQLVKALAERGLTPAEVTAVVNTHFHVDHVLNNSLFPSSSFYASQQSYDWCRSMYSDLLDTQNWERLVLKYYPEVDDYPAARESMKKLRKFALRWWDSRRLGHRSQFHWIETEPLPEGLEGMLTSGHVPGHLSIVVHDSKRPALVAGDAVLSRDPEGRILTMIPHNRKLFLEERDRILSKHCRIIPGHAHEFSTVQGRDRNQSTDRQE